MTPNHLPDQLARLGWSVPHLAARLGVSVTLAYGWHRGCNTRGNPTVAPDAVMVWLAQVQTAVDAIKPPSL